MKILQSILIAVFTFVIVVVLVALPVMLLWNYLAPAFDLTLLNFWQALALSLLTSLLFKSHNTK